jgi:nicotinate-nucleotide adenylyltransferase
MPDHQDIAKLVDKTFTEAFGRTPLKERTDDILHEAIELSRFTDARNLEEETGDTLASLIQLCNEMGWDFYEVLHKTIVKIVNRKLQYHSLGRKIRVALFGGAFDPVTMGHIETARFVLDACNCFDEVWFMPCGIHLHNKKLSSVSDRIEMLRLAINNDGRMKVFPYEIENKLGGETYKTLKLLLQDKRLTEQHQFSMIIGMDNANVFHKWVNFEHLEKLISFVVVPRAGVERDTRVDWYLKPPHIFLGHSDRPLRQVSSTLVKAELKKAHPNIKDMLPQEVYEYIKQGRLYGIGRTKR